MKKPPRDLDPIIRVGDLVRVEDPRALLRCGYPKAVEDYLPKISEKFVARVSALFAEAAGRGGLVHDDARSDRLVMRTLRDLAYRKAHADRFGGPERSLHLSEPQELWRGRLGIAVAARQVVTGHYCRGRAPYSSPNGYDEGDPPSLDGAKNHRIIAVRELPLRPEDKTFKPARARSLYPEFPSVHLTKMAPCATCGEKAPPSDPDQPRRVRTECSFDKGQCAYCGHAFEPVERA